MEICDSNCFIGLDSEDYADEAYITTLNNTSKYMHANDRTI